MSSSSQNFGSAVGGGRGRGRGRDYGRFGGGGYNNNHHRSGFGRGGGGGGRGRGPDHYGGGRGDTGAGRQFYGGRSRGRGGGGGRGRGRSNVFSNSNPQRFDPAKHLPIEEIGDVYHHHHHHSNNNTSNNPPSASTYKTNKSTRDTVTIAVEGCCHGELDMIYERLEYHSQQTGQKIDLLLCCGDFQSLRNPSDYHSSSIPPKYRSLGTFPKYYAGEKSAPILTIFISGNHEASQPLRELYYGGWVAPNIYYLGAAGVVQYRGIRIGGISGIYKSHDYEFGHYEKVPYDRSSTKSVYHVRNVDAYRMKCLSSQTPLDVMMSHDWPLGIEQHGNVTDLIRKKPHFRAEIERNDLGSLPNRQILDTIRPKHWFSAHLHVKFQATVRHNVHTGGTTGISDPCTKRTPAAAALVPSQIKSQPKPQGQKTEDDNAESPSNSAAKGENELHRCSQSTMDEEGTTEFHGLETSSGRCGDTGIGDLTDQMTRFLALDKCLPRRHYLSILRLPAQDRNTQPSLTELNGRDDDGDDDKTNATSEQQHQHRLHYDPEWLAILRKTHDLIVTDRRRVQVPEELHPLTQDEIDEVVLRFNTDISDPAREEKDPGYSVDDDPLQIPFDFIRTVPVYSDPVFHNNCDPPPLPAMGNPHTDRLLHILGLDHKLTIPYDADLTPSIVSEQLNMACRRTRHPPPPPPPPPGSLYVDVNEIDLDCIGDDENVHDPSVVENENRCSNDDEDEIDIDNVDEEDDKDYEGNKHNYSDGDTKQRVEAEPTTDAPSLFSTKRPRVGE